MILLLLLRPGHAQHTQLRESTFLVHNTISLEMSSNFRIENVLSVSRRELSSADDRDVAEIDVRSFAPAVLLAAVRARAGVGELAIVPMVGLTQSISLPNYRFMICQTFMDSFSAVSMQASKQARSSSPSADFCK